MSYSFGPRVPRNISAGTGPWFVQIFGVRNSYTWQELKDHVRPAASHVGHVAVYANGRATITVRKLDEAVCCFEYLSRNLLEEKRLYVELWETTPNRAPRLIWKNVERLPGQAAPSSHATQSHPTQLAPPLIPTQQEMMAQQMASMRLAKDQPAQAYQPAYQTSYLQQSGMQPTPTSSMPGSTTSSYVRVAQSLQVPRTVAPYTVAPYTVAPAAATRGPRYAIGSSGMPTNVDRGAVKMEYRGVFVSNLNYDVQDKDISKLFSTFGEITKMDHKRETKVNSKGKTVSRSKGSAVITYATSEQAQKAIDKLDGCTWNERRLALRRDKEATPINPPRKNKRTPTDGGPLIVDGSRYGD